MSETENVSKKRWYVLQAFSGFESRVAITLREYIKQQQMEDQFSEKRTTCNGLYRWYTR